MIATDNGSVPLVQLLLRSKASVNEVDRYGQTALMLAAGRGNLPTVKLLLAAKAKKDLVSKSGARAFDLALRFGVCRAAHIQPEALLRDKVGEGAVVASSPRGAYASTASTASCA